MDLNKKNEVMDYGKFFEREKKEKVKIPQEKKKFSFGFLKKIWFEMDKRTKVELIIFLIVVLITLGILTFHFLKEIKTPESFIYPPSQRVDFLPYEK
jgi:hypothetical protein